MHKIVAVDKTYLSSLCEELSQIDRAYSINLIQTNEISLSVSLRTHSDRKTLRMGYELFNQSSILCGTSYNHLGEKVSEIVNDHLSAPLRWTFPQIRIDNTQNQSFGAPFHRDNWILGDDCKGIIVWLPLCDRGSLSIIPEEISKNSPALDIEKDDYWGLKATNISGETAETITVEFGEALIFDDLLVHESAPVPEGQVTVQLRFWSPNNIEEYKEKDLPLVFCSNSNMQHVYERQLKISNYGETI